MFTKNCPKHLTFVQITWKPKTYILISLSLSMRYADIFSVKYIVFQITTTIQFRNKWAVSRQCKFSFHFEVAEQSCMKHYVCQVWSYVYFFKFFILCVFVYSPASIPRIPMDLDRSVDPIFIIFHS